MSDMVGVFMVKLFNMSLAGSAVILPVLVLRLFLRRVPKTYSCMLWLLVLVRLLWPFTLSSPFSLLPVRAEALMEMPLTDGTMPWMNTGLSAIDGPVNVILMNTMMPTPEASADPAQIIAAIGGMIWLAGLLLFAGVNLFRFIKIKRHLRDAVPEDGVYYSDRIVMPMVLGFWRPRIYLPSMFLKEESREERKLVLAHEYCHVKRKDHLMKFAAFAALAVHWFNSLVWLAFVLLCRDLEMACDERVMRELGEETKKQYSLTLLRFSERQSGLFIPLAFGESHTKSRIKNILNYKKPAFWITAAILVLIGAAALALLTDPQSSDSGDFESGAISVIGGADGPTSIFIASQNTGEEGVDAAAMDLETAEKEPYGMAAELDYVSAGKIAMHGSFGYLSFLIRDGGDSGAHADLNRAVTLEEVGGLLMQGDSYTEVLGGKDAALIIPNAYGGGQRLLYAYYESTNKLTGPEPVPEEFWTAGADGSRLSDAPIEESGVTELSGLVRDTFGSQMIYGPVPVPEYDSNVYGFLAADGETLGDIWYGLWQADTGRIEKIKLFGK